MIRVDRGPEPPKLVPVRARKLAELQALIVREGRDPLSTEIDGYRIVAEELWRAHLFKCCYCERKIERRRSDVEHYRPKAEANRGPHHAARHGYWWLAFTWENLLYACENCNQPPAKGVQFPLEAGCTPMIAQQPPPGGEKPLLIDPTAECGVDHIEFRFVGREKKWKPFARDKSAKGDETIRVCQLDRDDLAELYTEHVEENVRPAADAVKEALRGGDRRALHTAIWRADKRLLRPSQPYVGLSYDALQHFLPDAELPAGYVWSKPT